MKIIARNKLLHCFRPMVDMDVVNIEPKTVTDRSADQLGFKNLTAESRVTNNHIKVSENDCSTKNPKIVRQPAKRTFSRVVKAVFLETILSKRARDKKGFSKERPSLDLSNSNTDHEHTISVLENGKIVQTCSSSSSSNSTKTVMSERVQKQKRVIKNHEDHTEKQCHSRINITGLYLVFISLVMTVFWGKLCAIILTAIWLYFPRLSFPDNRGQENVTESPEIDQFKGHIKKNGGCSPNLTTISRWTLP